MASEYRAGLKDGLAIGVGYFSVSFTFGILAVNGGLSALTAGLISLTNLTSAGQFAGLTVILAHGSLFELALTQLVINLRYALMSLSLSQRLGPAFTTRRRMVVAFANTDEIFAVCGEELGLVGCLLVLLLLTAIILRCLWVARHASSPMSAYVAMGYGGMLLIQTFVNVASCLYIFPLVGLTLPFFSYGGSSILTLFACMGIVSGVKMRSLPSWLRDRSQL